jgi:hypothetical protein
MIVATVVKARDDLLSHGFSGESRSTNVISNVLEDVWYATVARHVSRDGIEIMNQNPTKIVGYCRVSTVEQADNGLCRLRRHH